MLFVVCESAGSTIGRQRVDSGVFDQAGKEQRNHPSSRTQCSAHANWVPPSYPPFVSGCVGESRSRAVWVTSYGRVSSSWLRLTGRCSDKSSVEVYMLNDCEG